MMTAGDSGASAADPFVARAQAHWSPEREAKVTAGRQWPVTPSRAPALLRALGLLNSDASMSADALRKLAQINHALILLKPALEDQCARHPTLCVVDVGCGTSSLSLIVAWLVAVHWRHPCRVLGLDVNPKVILASRQRAERAGLSAVARFIATRAGGDAATLNAGLATAFAAAAEPAESPSPATLRPHVLLALHACDTASDEALSLAISSRADVVAVAPCCHGELARHWRALGANPAAAMAQPHGALLPVFRSPHLRHETAAHLTDALRLLLLRSRGYEATAMEFVPSTHTPKNRLILGLRRGRYHQGALNEFAALKSAVGAPQLALEGLLKAGEDG